MSDCCRQCQGLESVFDDREARRNLRAYRKDGPSRSTRALLDALRAQGAPTDMTLLDIGGGVGAIPLELFPQGLRAATDVDYSGAYITSAREEATARGFGDRVAYLRGDFVALAPEVARADIVTLDRVICCYHDMPALVGASAAKAGRLYGLVFPRDSWLTRLAGRIEHVLANVFRSNFRFFIHRTADVEDVLRAHGLVPRLRRPVGALSLWQVAVYARDGAA